MLTFKEYPQFTKVEIPLVTFKGLQYHYLGNPRLLCHVWNIWSDSNCYLLENIPIYDIVWDIRFLDNQIFL